MTEQTLTQWVRGQLPSDERRQVTEWMIRCQDPKLPMLLDGIMQAERDALPDQSLLDLGPAWTQLVVGWQRLLEQGRAVLLDAPAGDFVMASTQGEPATVLQLTQRADSPFATLTAPSVGHYRLMYSSDAGQVRLLADALLNQDQSLEYAMDHVEGRSTLWALRGAPQAGMSPLEQLHEVLSTPQAATVLAALRLDPREA
ncbi:MAG: hypothetical protein ACI9VR_000361 [Cognaticolwellia sp.]|jgi:hypothetical protein